MPGVRNRLENRLAFYDYRVKPVPRDAGFPIGSYDFATQVEYNVNSDEYCYLRDYCIMVPEDQFGIDWNFEVALNEILRTRMMGRVKLSKALTRINRNFTINNLIRRESRTDQFVVSTRYTDILRCSETPHYESCFSATGCYKNIPALYLGNPGVAVAFVRDRSGHFSSRVFLYMLEDGNIAIGRVYGDKTFLNGIVTHFPKWVQASSGWDCDWASLKYPLSRQITYHDFGAKNKDGYYSPSSDWMSIKVTGIEVG